MKYSILVTAKKLSELKELFKSIEEIDYDKDSFEVVAVVEEIDVKLSPNFRLVFKKIDKKGIAAGRNEGIKVASGDIFVFTDSDCKVPKNWLSTLEKYDEDAIAGNARLYYKTKFGKFASFIGYPAGGNLGFEKVFEVEKGYASQLSTCNAAIKSKIARKLKFDENLMGSEDKDISIRLIEKGYKIKYAPDWYVFHPSKDYINEFAKWMFNRGKHAYYFVKKYRKSKKDWKKHVASILKLSFPANVITFFLFSLGFLIQLVGYVSCHVKIYK